MRGKLQGEGHYELFQTTHGHRILCLDDERWFAVVEGQQSDILVGSDGDHEKADTVRSGKYFYADFENDPEFRDQPHLFLEEGRHFREYVLPQGLPCEKGDKVRLIRSEAELSAGKVREHVKGKGDRGGEKQFEGEPEGLRNRTKDELYRMARDRGVRGRSSMNKADLVRALSQDEAASR